MLKSNDFYNLYEVSKGAVEVAHHSKHPFIFKKGKELWIDDIALKRRKEFNKKIWLKNHENYYKLAEYWSDAEIAKALHIVSGTSCESSWREYIKLYLFSLASQETSILVYKINAKQWIFYRLTTRVVRKLERTRKIYRGATDIIIGEENDRTASSKKDNKLLRVA